MFFVFVLVFDGFVPRSFGLFVFLVVAVVLVVRRNSATTLGDDARQRLRHSAVLGAGLLGGCVLGVVCLRSWAGFPPRPSAHWFAWRARPWLCLLAWSGLNSLPGRACWRHDASASQS